MKSKKSSSGAASTRWYPTHEQIAERAHRLWMEEGQPEGRDLHHWLRAEHELRSEHNGGDGDSGPAARGLSREDVESDKRVDGLIERARDQRSPKQERL